MASFDRLRAGTEPASRRSQSATASAEIELIRARKMAVEADASFLIYLIDMAIIEANARARGRGSVEDLIE